LRALTTSPGSWALASGAAVDVLAKDPEREAAVRSTCPLGLPAGGVAVVRSLRSMSRNERSVSGLDRHEVARTGGRG
jgi:hypothetical protein